MSLRTNFVQHVLFPLADKIRGRSLKGAMEQLETTQWWPHARLVDWQGWRLRALIQRAYEYVPYYREVMQARKLTPADIRTTADLAKLPLLTREDVRGNYPAHLHGIG